jgi:TrpR-related protein YerC/YecD
MSKGMNKNTSINTVKLIQGIGKEVDWTLGKRVQFVESILSLKNADETKRFLRDLMTTGEIEEFSNRLLAAQLLSKDVQYNAIIEETGLSSATIARISKWLNGSLGGYRLVLNRLSSTHHNNSTKIEKGLS